MISNYETNLYYLKKKTQAMIDTENYIDKYIVENNKPPSYRQIADTFGLRSSAAAYHRVKHCRGKMNKQKVSIKCSYCGRTEICTGSYPEGCFLENEQLKTKSNDTK